MRFVDFFIEYKIGLKNIKGGITHPQLPLYRKIFLILLFSLTILFIIFALLNNAIGAFIILFIIFLMMFGFSIVDSRKKNMEATLNNYYKPYSRKRMDMLKDLLHNYNIDVNDKDKIDLLIEEAQNAQKQCDYLAPLKNSLKILAAIIVPIIAFIANKAEFSEDLFRFAINSIVLIILAFPLVFAVTPFLKELFYKNYNKYDELINDLKQIKLFY